jgi:hypothetical protein
MFSALMLAILLWSIRRFKGNKWWQWLFLPMFMTIWANLYAGVLDGFVLLGVFCASWWIELAVWRVLNRRVEVAGTWRDAAGFSLAIGASFVTAFASVWAINPNGYDVLLYPINFLVEPFWRSLIGELQPPCGTDVKMLLAYTLFMAFAQIIGWKRFRSELFLATIVFGYLAWHSQRAVLMFAVVSAPYLARLAGSISIGQRWFSRRSSLCAIAVVWVLIFSLAVLPNQTYRMGVGLYRPYYPMGVYSFMKDHVPRQNVFNDMMYGGGILWFLYPEFKPFIDGRSEAYSMGFWKDEYQAVSIGLPYWRTVFNKYSVSAALVRNINEPSGGKSLALRLHGDPSWALVAFDDNALLFLEKTEQNISVIRKYEYRLLWPMDTGVTGITGENAKEAIAEAVRAVEWDPGGRFARTCLARAYMVAGDYARSSGVYESLVKERGAGAGYWRDYAYCLFMAGRTTEAEDVAERVVRMGVDPASGWYVLHLVAARRGDKVLARKYIDKVIEKCPNEPLYRSVRDRLTQ